MTSNLGYNSIKKQTLQKVNDEYIFEWIIVDDGSSDNTKEIVEKWKNESAFIIRYFYQENHHHYQQIKKALL